MHVTLVHVHVKSDHLGAFIEASRANHETSVKEPDNRRFDILQNPADPGHFVLYEAYCSAADAAAHKETAHYARWRDTVAPMMAQPRQGVPMNGFFPQADMISTLAILGDPDHRASRNRQSGRARVRTADPGGP